MFSLCATAQSPSTVLSTLHTRGTTVTGGEHKYRDYIPRLDETGRLSFTVLPTNAVLGFVMDYVNEHGSDHDITLVEDLESTVMDRFDTEFTRYAWLSAEVYSNAVRTALNSVKHYEEDPVYLEHIGRTGIEIYTNASTVAMGEGAIAVAGSWQFGQGTNQVENTFRFKNTVLVDYSGAVPESSVPWAVTKQNFNEVTNELLHVTGGYVNDIGFPEIYTKYLVTNNTSIPVCLVGSFISRRSVPTNMVFYGSVVYNNPAANDTAPIVYKENATLVFSRDNTASPYIINGTYYPINRYGHNKVRISVSSGGLVSYALVEGTDGIGGEVIENSTLALGPTTNGLSSVASRVLAMDENTHSTTCDLSTPQPPVDYVDLKSPSGNIFRIRVSDDGEMILTRVK